MGAPAYHSSIREALTARMLAGVETPTMLFRETGIPIGTLARWHRGPVTLVSMPRKSPSPSSSKIRSTRQWSVAEKLRVLTVAEGTTDDKLGELLRREGVHEADLELWRIELGDVLAAQSTAARTAEKRLHAVEAELREVRALLELQKKVDALFGQGDGGADAPTRNRGK